MSFTESNEQRPKSAYELGAEWNSKGFFWLPFAVAGNLAAVVLGVVNVSTPGSQLDLLAWQWLVAIPIGWLALVRLTVCFRRARRIWAGVR